MPPGGITPGGSQMMRPPGQGSMGGQVPGKKKYYRHILKNC